MARFQTQFLIESFHFLCQGKDVIIRLREEELQAFLSQRRTRNRKERRPRPSEDNNDFDEDEDEDGELFELEDTYTDDFTIEKK